MSYRVEVSIIVVVGIIWSCVYCGGKYVMMEVNVHVIL